jgi:heme exporter protein A
MSPPALEARALACTLGNRKLFDGLGFALPEGRWMMLAGANGSGKTTLLRILAGLSVPASGEVLWRGQPRRAADPAWNSLFAYQGHAAGWKASLTVRENLALQAELDCESPDLIDDALARVALMRQRALPFARLSAGQRRRVGLARLVLSRRPLWLLDEPTTALDTDGQRLFADLLEQHLEGGGCAVVATHLDFPARTPAIELRLGST